MIDMTQVNPQRTQGTTDQPFMPTADPNVPQNQIVGGVSPSDLGTAQNQMLGGVQPTVGTQAQTQGDLIKWATYGQGQRPPQWTQWPEGYDAGQAGNWYRDPNYPAHLVWNPRYGFQNYKDVLEQIKTGKGIQEWGMESHPDWWEEYDISKWGLDPGAVGPNKFSGGGGAGGGSDFNWTDYMNFINQQGQGDVPGQYWSDPMSAPQGQGFQYPAEWPIASNTMSKYAMGHVDAPTPWYWDEAGKGMRDVSQTGYATPIPWQWTSGSEFAKGMMETGLPTSQDEWYQQAKGIAQTDIEDAIKQAAEQAGLSGLRWSTPMGRSAQDIAGRTMANVGLEWTGREMDALEQARQRQLAASQQMYGYGQGMAGLKEAAAGRQMQGLGMMGDLGSQIANMRNQAQNRQLQAAGMLQGMGQDYLRAPQDWAAQMYQMGTGMQGQQQSAYDRAYQEFLRMTMENNPWMAQALGFSGLQSNMAPQQYQPSFLSQLLGLGGLGLGAYGALK